MGKITVSIEGDADELAEFLKGVLGPARPIVNNLVLDSVDDASLSGNEPAVGRCLDNAVNINRAECNDL